MEGVHRSLEEGAELDVIDGLVLVAVEQRKAKLDPLAQRASDKRREAVAVSSQSIQNAKAKRIGLDCE
jgi:hypothetical protein